ncbi:hypothetical protein ACPPVV_17680 [Rhodanobacter sp. Col0626]|uniref:hypothetical protein n=1 Tax=Rhodanobacter sp. Col0626 TaxID=3415679 RepID=UPI003CFA7404
MKSRTELEVELEEVEKKITPTSKQLDDLLNHFAVSVVPEVKGWIKKEAISQMEENHAKVNEAGVDFVREFKGDVVALLENIDEICLIALGPKDRWPHNKELQQQDLYASSQNDFFSDAFRRAISSLGKILDARGLLTGSTQNSSWRRAPSRGYEYAYHPGFDGRKYEEVETYRELLRTHWELKQSVSRIKVSIEKAKTRELWDEV